MAPNIEVERIKPVKGNMALLSRQYTLITLTSITIVITYICGRSKRIYAKIGKYEHVSAKVFAIGFKGVYCVYGAFRAILCLTA